MSKKKKMAVTVLCALLLLLLAALIFAGNYMVSFAIGRTTGTTDVAPPSVVSEEDSRAITENWQRLAQQTQDWAEAVQRQGVTVQSADGLTLSGEYILQDQPSHLWLIAVHGYRGNHSHMLTIASFYGQRGYNVLHTASLFSSLRAGYSFTEASALEQVKKAKVPMLFIHGEKDNFVRTEMVYPLYEACPTEKQLLVVEGAGHAVSYRYAPKLYFDTVFAFLDRFFAPDAEFSENQP